MPCPHQLAARPRVPAPDRGLPPRAARAPAPLSARQTQQSGEPAPRRGDRSSPCRRTRAGSSTAPRPCSSSPPPRTRGPAGTRSAGLVGNPHRRL